MSVGGPPAAATGGFSPRSGRQVDVWQRRVDRRFAFGLSRGDGSVSDPGPAWDSSYRRNRVIRSHPALPTPRDARFAVARSEHDGPVSSTNPTFR